MTMLVSTRAGVEHDARRARQRLGEAARVGVILGQPRDVVLERVEAGGGEDAGLAHAAAEHLAPAVRAVDERLRAREQRADRRAEPLGQADADGVERRRQLAARDMPVAIAAFKRRAPSRCRARLLLRVTLAISRISRCGKMLPPPRLCVFSTATSVVGAKWWLSGLMRGGDLGGREEAALVADDAELHAGQRAAGARLEHHAVRALRRRAPRRRGACGCASAIWFAIVPDGT